MGRVLSETGNLENENGHGKVMIDEKLALRNVVSYLSLSYTESSS